MRKLIAVVELPFDNMDEADDFMQALFSAGNQAGVVDRDYTWVYLEGTESTGETLH